MITSKVKRSSRTTMTENSSSGMSLSPALFCLFALLSSSPLARAQSAIAEWDGQPGDEFGRALCLAGDVDGDGVPDLMVGSPGAGSFPGPCGAVRVFSGATGAQILEVVGPDGCSQFGVALSGLGDVDGDGRGDFAVGAPQELIPPLFGVGKVRAYSGATGQVLWSLEATDPTMQGFGMALERLPDVDFDGVDELLIGIGFGCSPPTNCGVARVRVVSSADGSLLYELTSPSPTPGWFGAALAAIGDVDGDGLCDFAVGDPTDKGPGNAHNSGAVSIFSGFDGSLIRFVQGTSASHFGTDVSSLGDVDGDGIPEVLVGSNLEAGWHGRVWALSVVTGQAVYQVTGDEQGNQLGLYVAGFGDLTGDGIPDFGANYGAKSGPTAEDAPGTLRVFSGLDGTALYDLGSGSIYGGYGAIAPVADWNGDGIPDFALGAPVSRDNGLASGKVVLFSGTCLAPESYCTAAPNSAGPGAHLVGTGSQSLAANSFALQVTGAVPGQFGLFFYGPERIEVPFGDGVRCVGAGFLGLFRLNPPMLVGPAGSLVRGIDLAQPPTDAGPGAVTAGSTWNFQFWYRDPAAGQSGFNLSDAVSAAFCR